MGGGIIATTLFRNSPKTPPKTKEINLGSKRKIPQMISSMKTMKLCISINLRMWRLELCDRITNSKTSTERKICWQEE